MNSLSSWGLPKEVIFCKKCIISNQRPGTVSEFKNKSTKDSKEKKAQLGLKTEYVLHVYIMNINIIQLIGN